MAVASLNTVTDPEGQAYVPYIPLFICMYLLYFFFLFKQGSIVQYSLRSVIKNNYKAMI